MYQWVLFDWDGCIANTLPSWMTICKKALNRQGIDPPPSLLWEKYCLGDIPKQFNVKDYDGCKRDIGEIAFEIFEDLQLYEGAADTLRALAKNKSLALVTNTRSRWLHRALKQHDLQDYFDVVIDGESQVRPKPDPEGIEQACRLLGAPKSQTVMIGDTFKDLRAAKAAGVDSILFYPPAHKNLYDLRELKKDRPTYIVEDFKDLSSLLTEV